MQRTRKIPTKMAILCVLALAALILLAALAPYVDDDWDWGGPGGLERLAQGFADYNGRYLGNALVLLLTRSRALKAAAVGVGFFLMAYLPARAAAKGSGTALLLSLSLLLAMPSAMLGQTLAWASGFANYGVAAAALLGTLALLMPLWRGEGLSRGRCAALAALGVAGSLLVEHVTICLAALGVAASAFAALRARRALPGTLALLAGALLGAAVMFQNGGYAAVSAAADPYRALLLPQGQNALLYYSGEYAQRIRPHLFDANLPLMALLAAGGLGLTKRGRAARLCAWTLTAYTAYLCVRAANPDWAPLAVYTAHAENLLSLLGALSLLGLALCVQDVARRRRMLALLLCVAAMSAPLLAVRPVNARNFLPAYVAQVWFALELLAEARLPLARLRIPAAAALCALLALLVSVYGKNCAADIQRVAYARAEVEAGAQRVYLPRLPYEQPYEWSPTPGDSPLTHAFFKSFYGLPQEVELRVVDYDAWYVIRRLAPGEADAMGEDALWAWMLDEAGVALED